MTTITKLPAQFGHFRLLQKLGEGGMGAVYLAEDTRLGCRVALKVPHLDEGDDPKLIERFHREARLAQSVHHPYLCPVYETGNVEGVHYLTMPFIEGTPLSRLVGPDQLWEQRRAAELVRRVALALQALHERQVIHRDLKPHNIMLRPAGEPMLMDFGLARALGGEQPRLTSTGRSLGTPTYMAPELVNGDGETLGPATDVYSLGVILYELLTGRVPFEAPNLMALFYQILTLPPAPPSTLRGDLEPALEAVCLKALAKKGEDRQRGMVELAAQLEASLPPGPGGPPPPAAEPRVSPAPGSGPVEKVDITCPKCAIRLRVSARSRGKRIQCPRCQGSFKVLDELPRETLRARSFEPTPRGGGANRALAITLGDGVQLKLVWIPAGAFLMGSPPSEPEHTDDEAQHKVILTRGFYLGIHPVTQIQWRTVMGTAPSKFQGDDRPVEMVSWDECMEFCGKVSAHEGKCYRLPTEAEWEFACRAGTTTPFSFGETISTDEVNYDGNYPYVKGRIGAARRETTPVGTFPANAFGLYGMHGNVWEWCGDWYAPGRNTDATDPKGPYSGEARVLRGGSWLNRAGRCRSAFRSRNLPGLRLEGVGFRVCVCMD